MLFLIIPFSATSQKTDYKFVNISTNQGLSESNVNCIIQDDMGFMWFGTRDGLNKYDGYEFTVYKNNPADRSSLSNNTIRNMVQDKDGKIWIATWGGGVSVFDPEKEAFTSFKHDKNNPNSLPDNFINNVHIDKEGDIWMGTYTNGLARYDKKTGKFKTYLTNKDDVNSISDNNISHVYEDGFGILWIGTTNGGLNRFDKKEEKFTRYQHDPKDPGSLSFNRVRLIFMDSRKNLWVGTYGGGLDLLDPETQKFIHHKKEPDKPGSICHNVIFALAEDMHGNLWVGTENGGISIYDYHTKSFHHYDHNKFDRTSLSNNSVYSILQDKKGNMWIGTYSGGIDLVDADAFKFRHYRQNENPNSLNNNNVLSIFEDADEQLWVATDGGGLNVFDRKLGEFKHFIRDDKNKNSLCGNYVLGVFEDSKGNIWASTWGDGVSKYNKKSNTFTNFRHDPNDAASLGSDNVWLVYEDKLENIWIGTFGGGLCLYDPINEKFTTYRKNAIDSTTLSSDFIYYIYEDLKNNLWIGTDGGGLNLLDRKSMKFRHFIRDEAPGSISNNSVNCIYEDSKGRLWVSTDVGLNLMDRKNFTFTSYFTKDGLPNNMTFGILEDNAGYLWLSTNKGLSKCDPQKMSFTNFTVADGLQHNEFKRLAFCKSKEGYMYFGGINGFNEFKPEEVKENAFDPPLIISKLELFNKPIPVRDSLHPFSPLEKHISKTKHLVLSYKESVISLEFASLNFTMPEKKKYAYMLEGFDNDWNDVGTKRTVSYTNLDPGAYVFKVKGLNNEGQWSENITTLSMTIVPPFWDTVWFEILVGLSFIGAAFSTYRIRVHQIERQKKALEKQVNERTAEVVQQKEEIKAQSKQLEHLYNEITESIRAAQTIQQSILPTQKSIKMHLPQSFVLNMPKDVVSGDFYWFNQVHEHLVLAVVDCTGHGVSGAFMSINGHHLLNQSVIGLEEINAAEILNRLNSGLIKEMHQEDEDSKTRDGMDVALCVIDKDHKNLQFAGANSPLYLIRNNELHQIKGNKYAVGLSMTRKVNTFDNHVLPLEEGDCLYIFSDGYADQLGGENGDTKFMYNRFRDLLLDIHHLSMDLQIVALDEAITNWRRGQEQIDDILIVGFKIQA